MYNVQLKSIIKSISSILVHLTRCLLVDTWLLSFPTYHSVLPPPSRAAVSPIKPDFHLPVTRQGDSKESNPCPKPYPQELLRVYPAFLHSLRCTPTGRITLSVSFKYGYSSRLPLQKFQHLTFLCRRPDLMTPATQGAGTLD